MAMIPETLQVHARSIVTRASTVQFSVGEDCPEASRQNRPVSRSAPDTFPRRCDAPLTAAPGTACSQSPTEIAPIAVPSLPNKFAAKQEAVRFLGPPIRRTPQNHAAGAARLLPRRIG